MQWNIFTLYEEKKLYLTSQRILRSLSTFHILNLVIFSSHFQLKRNFKKIIEQQGQPKTNLSTPNDHLQRRADFRIRLSPRIRT